MDRSTLVRWFGFAATLIHGDTLVLDRWLWICRWLPLTRNGERLLDAGCGSGAFTIGAARRGYHATGLSWDLANQSLASKRAALCGVTDVNFPIQDIRTLDQCADYAAAFDVVLCCEVMEHVLDDARLMRALAACLKPGGYLLLTAPYQFARPISVEDEGPFAGAEDGAHVRRGYAAASIRALCRDAGLEIETIENCGGWLSQMITRVWRWLPGPLRFPVTLPLRLLPPLFDPVLSRVSTWPGYSICVVAFRPRPINE